ncbi:hypothetical protein [Brevibacillus laterosporus]|uniref:hypothetical protein n=1 Tax=Brevibacillus laterosporus TaxID=1465 RepID=UPI00264F73FA|nr:hypothetical protein [Brevibacillus laterosporus]MDN9010013.1 hypothetical protein [Brevibacillus laterosporus]MDO0940605.1 hypothetical protein [Brevibacillus laterosporus]
MREVERFAWKIIWRGVKCAVLLAVILWCIGYELPKRIESYGPKHVQTKQTDSSKSDADGFLLDYMYYHYLPQTTILF